MRDKITVIGSMNYDVILKLSRFPELGETLPAKEVTFSAGGKGANQAVQAAKLGVPTYMIGCVGDDSNGQMLIDSAREYGVNIDYVKRKKTATGMGVVQAVEDGTVQAVIVRGANYEITKEDIDEAKDLLLETKLVILQMEISSDVNLYAIDKAKEAGCQILLNAAPAEEIPEEYLKKIDLLVVNEVEAAFYLNTELNTLDVALEKVQWYQNKLQTTCIFTLGKAGLVVADGQETRFIKAEKVEAVETTGAGDSFIGAMGYALLAGMDVIKACEFATRCSAITVCRPGAQPAMPMLEEVK